MAGAMFFPCLSLRSAFALIREIERSADSLRFRVSQKPAGQTELRPLGVGGPHYLRCSGSTRAPHRAHRGVRIAAVYQGCSPDTFNHVAPSAVR